MKPQEKKNENWILKISCHFDANLELLNNKADTYIMSNRTVKTLQMIDQNATDLTLAFELEGETEKLPVLKAVTNLIILYKVTDIQAKLLARIFPQFTEAELKAKGRNN